MCRIRTVFDFNRELQAGKYVWPGGYPRFAVCRDGGALCWQCVTNEAPLIRDAVIGGERNDGWNVGAIDVNWEDADLTCDHCGAYIDSAYGEPNHG